MPIKFRVKKPSATAHGKKRPQGRDARRRPAEPRTNRDQGIDQAPHVGFGVIGRRGDPEPLLPAGDGRIADRLSTGAELDSFVTEFLFEVLKGVMVSNERFQI
jgi:hypothetical protein